MIPAMSVPLAPLSLSPTSLLELPVDGLFGAVLPVLAVLAIGAVASALLRGRRQARPGPVPSSVTA